MIEPPATSYRYHLLPIAASFAAGIALGRHGPDLPCPWAWFLALLFLILLNQRRRQRHSGKFSVVLFWLLFTLAGLLRFTTLPQPQIPPGLVEAMNSDQELVISGHLEHPPSFDGRLGKILVKADQQWRQDGAISPLDLQILLKMPFAPPVTLVPGDRVLLRTTLRRPDPPGNPGTFDYRRYLADRSILVTGFLSAPADLAVIHEPGNHTTGLLEFIGFRIQRWRQRINRFIANGSLQRRDVGLYQALLTGERSLLSKTTREDFKNSGTFHLLAISGMHLALLALLCGLIISRLLQRSTTLLVDYPCRKITAALILVILCLYTILAGLQPPVVRALIMAATFIAALLLDRPTSPGNSLGLAALLTLAWQPAALFLPSFQLSYLAVAGILAFAHRFPRLFPSQPSNSEPLTRIRHWLTGGMAVSAAAIIALAPLTAFHFGQVTLLSPISTLLVSPFLCFWALPLGLAGVIISDFFPIAASFLLKAGALGLHIARALAACLASLPLASWQTGPPPLLLLPLYYGMLALICYPTRRRAVSWLTLTLLMPAIVLVLYYPDRSPSGSGTTATFLDVGQGSCALLEFAEGQKVLVDGGSNTGSAGDFDLGEQVIAPFLRHRGLTRLDAIVVSHDHADHYDGLPYIVKHFHPRTVWLNGTGELSPALTSLVSLAIAAGSRIRVPGQGETILQTRSSRLTCLSSFHLSPDRPVSENSRSLVLELESSGHRIILPGDIMEEEGKELLKDGLIRESEVLLAPHHGSDNSASLVLSRALHPAWVVVSAGSAAGENFPGRKFLGWCLATHAQLHRTGSEGAISFELEPQGIHWQKLSAKSGKGAKAGRL